MSSPLKVLLSLLITTQLCACAHSKSQPERQTQPAAQTDGIVGTVVQAPSPEGAYWQLRYEDAEGQHILIPVELADEFKVDGLTVVFKYHLSRMQQRPDQAGQPCVVEEMRRK